MADVCKKYRATCIIFPDFWEDFDLHTVLLKQCLLELSPPIRPSYEVDKNLKTRLFKLSLPFNFA